MKHAYDFKNVRSVTAWALMFKGKHAGRFVANLSDNPNGPVCTATFSIWAGPLSKPNKPMTGISRGYVHDKLSQAVFRALLNEKFRPKVVTPESGRARQEFEAWGYEVVPVIG